jgi:hypothetical protein
MSEYAALEARVSALETEAHHVQRHEIRAVGYAVSSVHEEVRAVRATQEQHTETLRVHGETLAQHTDLLEEILRRLPPAAD